MVDALSGASGGVLAKQSPLGAHGKVDLRGENSVAGFAERHQVPVKQGVEVGAKQEAIEDVEALGIGDAFGPRLRVARAHQLWDRDAGDGAGAGAASIVDETFAVNVLADALADKSLDFCRLDYKLAAAGTTSCTARRRRSASLLSEFRSTNWQIITLRHGLSEADSVWVNHPKPCDI
jgi:hypothetical protein